MKLKAKVIFGKSRTHFSRESYDLDVPKFREKCMVKLELVKFLFGTENYMNIRPAHWIILDSISDLKTKEIEDSVIFAK